jgi:NAD(P)-dependent dehydrogenase (short-subunit alcohol dehydrogenase family)
MNLNKIYIIAGASNGLGYQYAKKIAKKNRVIGLFYKTKRKNEKNINFFKVNLENTKEIKQFFLINGKFLSKAKKIIFINFATCKKDSLVIDIEERDLRRAFGVNLFSNFLFTSNLIKSYINKEINIIFISSSLGLKGDSGTALYSSSKAGLEGLMKSIVVEYSASFKIRCNTLVLGFFDSPLWQNLTDQKKKNIMKLIPNAKLGKINHIVNATKFIESNSYINSRSIFLDGGFGNIKI